MKILAFLSSWLLPVSMLALYAAEPEPATPSPPPAKVQERSEARVVVNLERIYTKNHLVGGVTLFEKGDEGGARGMWMRPGDLVYTGSSRAMAAAERPGDLLGSFIESDVALPGKFAVGTVSNYATGEGSELRWVGSHRWERDSIQADPSSRLAFRNADGEWCYVCGLGECTFQGVTVLLGQDRTVESCLALLTSKDPILREGGARDLGRLSEAKDAEKVVSNLIPLLKDSSPFVRRGAAEGLGLVGSAAAFETLAKAKNKEKDKLTSEFIAEAMGFIGAYALLGDPTAIAIPLEQAATAVAPLCSKKKQLGAWHKMQIERRISLRTDEAMTALAKSANSKKIAIATAASNLKVSFDSKSPLAVAKVTTTGAESSGERAAPLAGASALDLAAGKVGEQRIADLGNGVKLGLCGIPAGKFKMGDTGKDDTRHEVTLTKPFWLGQTEVTQEQWKALMGRNPSKNVGNDLPVEQVNWDEASEFCRKLNALGLLPDGWRFALPTEAQWEYACRAGTLGKYAGTLDEMAWHSGNSGSKPHPVGTKKANAWGLNDMHGNAWEWCADWYNAYPDAEISDPTGPRHGSLRVYRGGSWGNVAPYCGSASRGRGPAAIRYSNLGFRVAAVPPMP